MFYFATFRIILNPSPVTKKDVLTEDGLRIIRNVSIKAFSVLMKLLSLFQFYAQ